MKNISMLSLLTTIVLFCLLISCKKPVEEVPKFNIPLDTGLLAYCCPGEEGSWWIYEKSNGINDTFNLQKRELLDSIDDSGSNFEKYNYTYDVLHLIMVEGNSLREYFVSGGPLEVEISVEDPNCFIASPNGPFSYGYYHFLMNLGFDHFEHNLLYPVDLLSTFGGPISIGEDTGGIYPFNEYQDVELLDSIKIKDEIYIDIIKVIHKKLDGEKTTLIASEYYARNIGLIKRDYFYEPGIELVSYKIKK